MSRGRVFSRAVEMPANTTPEYKKAEAEFRRAREPADRLSCLREMLRTVPKHKGTEHIQADIKSRIKELTEELAGPKKGGAKTGPPQAVRPEGAAQAALLGAPNVGKSSIVARLTGARAEVGPYPYATKFPLPGMLPFQDIHIQLVDLPPVSRDFMEPWFVNCLQTADAALLVVDLTDPECADHVLAIRERLNERKVSLEEVWPGSIQDEVEGRDVREADEGEPKDPFRLHLPTLLLANKSELYADPAGEAGALMDILGVKYPLLTVSAQTGVGLGDLGPALFRGLGILRVYTKVPGKPPDLDRPYTLRRGQTVSDLARLVHKDLARSLSFGRIWGSGQFEGQQVGPDHRLADRDVIELHT